MYMNNQKRSTTNFTYNPNHQVSIDFIKTVNINDSQVYERLLNLLATHYQILDFDVNPICTCATTITLGENRTFDSALTPPPHKKKLCQYALARTPKSELPCLIRVLLIFQHEHYGKNFNFVYAQVFQNITIPISGIPECQFDISNSDMMSPSCDLSLFKFDDLLTSVAVLKSQISNKLFFFWPEMKRADIKIYPNDDMFCYENFVHQGNSKKSKRKGKSLL